MFAADRDQLVLTGCDLVTSLNPLTGETLWEVEGATTECVTSTVTDGQRIFTSGGYPRNHLSAVRADGSGRIDWETGDRIYVPSMLLRDGTLYAVLDAGVAACWDSATGKQHWKHRLGGTFSASPILVGRRIYATERSRHDVRLPRRPGSVRIARQESTRRQRPGHGRHLRRTVVLPSCPRRSRPTAGIPLLRGQSTIAWKVNTVFPASRECHGRSERRESVRTDCGDEGGPLGAGSIIVQTIRLDSEACSLTGRRFSLKYLATAFCLGWFALLGSGCGGNQSTSSTGETPSTEVSKAAEPQGSEKRPATTSTATATTLDTAPRTRSKEIHLAARRRLSAN